MVKKLSALTALCAALLTGSYANAGLVDVMEIDQQLNWGESVEYTHDITEDFDLGTAESASLAIEIFDDDRWWEVMLVVVEDFNFDTGGITFGSFENGLEGGALAALNADGELNVSIHSMLGDFFVGNSTLSVTTRSVPEPGTLALLALGVFGLGWARRRNARA